MAEIAATSQVGRSTWPRRGQGSYRRTADDNTFLDALAAELELAPIVLADRNFVRREPAERKPLDDRKDRQAFHTRLMPPGWRDEVPANYEAGSLFTLAG